MDTDEAVTLKAADAAAKEAAASGAAEAATEEAAEEGGKVPPPADPEPASYEVANPARVVPSQQKYIAFPAGARWEPLRRGAKSGIVLLRDLRPGALPHRCAPALYILVPALRVLSPVCALASCTCGPYAPLSLRCFPYHQRSRAQLEGSDSDRRTGFHLPPVRMWNSN